MRKIIISPNEIISYFDKEKISTMSQMKKTFMTSSTMTIFRRLKSLGYLTSYSHRGKYYTLMNIAAFNKQGIWSCRSVWFSAQGNLCNTVKHFVTHSEAGWSAQELENILYVEVKRPLLQLFISKEVYREKSAGVYVYYSTLPDVQRMQLLMRREKNAEVTIGLPAQVEALSHELKAAIILFFSLLDEQQRRLYAGLEAYKMGHGGDRQISELLGMDVHTVAKGRRELFRGDVLRRGTIRKHGGGRKQTEKKRHKSSIESKK